MLEGTEVEKVKEESMLGRTDVKEVEEVCRREQR